MKLSHSKNVISILSLSQKWFLAIVLGLFVGTAEASLSVADYCQLTIDSMRQQITYMRGLITLANQHQSESPAYLQQEQQKRVEHDASLQELYALYQTTGEEYILYMGAHKKKVEAYLQAYPEVKTTIDTLAQEIRTLIEEYDALKAVFLGTH